MPPLFTQDYVFEFSKGKVRTQHLVTTPLDKYYRYEFVLCKNHAASAKEIKLAVFCTLCIDNLDPENLKLPRKPVKQMDNKKVLSLQKKYKTIPADKLNYFPEALADSDDDDEPAPAAAVSVPAAAAGAPATPKRKKEAVAPGARKKTGPKPKNALPLGVGFKSMMSFFGKKKIENSTS